MQFRDHNYNLIESDAEIVDLVTRVKDFMKRIAPRDCHEHIEENYRDLTVVFHDAKTRRYHTLYEGNYPPRKKKCAGNLQRRYMPKNVNGQRVSNEQYLPVRTITGVIAIAPITAENKTRTFKTVVHECIHAFSHFWGKHPRGHYFQCGCRFLIEREDERTVYSRGVALNECVTDLLCCHFGAIKYDESNTSYAKNFIVSDMLIGENIENNAFLQGVFFGDGKVFGEEINASFKRNGLGVRYRDMLGKFDAVKGNTKAYDIVKGIILYRLDKALETDELDKEIAFQRLAAERFITDIAGFYMSPEEYEHRSGLLQFIKRAHSERKGVDNSRVCIGADGCAFSVINQ
jgi:hypothetical protein